MERSAWRPIPCGLLSLSLLGSGCSQFRPTTVSQSDAKATAVALDADSASSPIRQVAWEQPNEGAPAERSASAPRLNREVGSAAVDNCSLEHFVEQVLARNPSLAQMTAAWETASTRYQQVTALEDPMFGSLIGPGSIGSNEVDFAYRLEVSQKLPFPGKRALRGQAAQSETAAAGNEVDDMRLQLIESAKVSYYEHYLIGRALVVNEENLRLFRAFRDAARLRYEKALAPEQDVAQAEVEIGRQQERSIVLERMLKVARARMNTLLHQGPDAPLPPPPEQLPAPGELPTSESLRALALAGRPDLQALHNRIAADEAALKLAFKEFCPDFEVMAAYDAWWQRPEQDLRPMLGLRLNLPVQKERRWAAIAEARSRIAERRASLDARIDQANYQIQEALEQAQESDRVAVLYEKTILPAAKRNVDAARSAYETGTVPFIALVEAQKNRSGLMDRYYEAVAESAKRRATLDRVVGAK